MATARLIPSTYSTNDTGSYIAITNESNMYANVDSTNYTTVTNNSNSTGSYYIYLKGFNFDAIPDNATVSSFTIKLKAYESGCSTSSSYAPKICNDTTTLTGTMSALTTSVLTLSFTGLSTTWENLKALGSNFGIRINTRRSNRNTTSYVYIYGAEILVEYEELVSHNITITLESDDITVTPSGTNVGYEGHPFEINISATEEPSVIDNGVDVTALLTTKAAQDTLEAVIASYTTSGSISGTYYQLAVDKGSNATTVSGNNYCSTSGSTADINYKFDLSSIPSTAEIVNVTCAVKGHLESTSNSNEVAKCLLYNGTTAKGSATSFTSTSDAVINLDCGTWTRSELDNLLLKFTIGYYGGNVSGATLSVSYSLGDGVIYVYTIPDVLVDHTIIVSEGTPATYYTVNSTILNGTLLTNNPLTIREGRSATIQFKGDTGIDFTSMKINGVSVLPTEIQGDTEEATWDLSTNYSTYQTYNLSNAKDGDTSSYFWSSEALATGKYILVTFSKEVTLNSFSTYSSNSGDYPQSCNTLLISTDGNSWEDIGTFLDSLTSTFNNINKTCKYVRIYAKSSSSGGNWLVLNEITMDYSIQTESYYQYIIDNVTSDLIVVIIFGLAALQLQLKTGGSWIPISKVYKKINGLWVEQSDIGSLFSTTAQYLKMN